VLVILKRKSRPGSPGRRGWSTFNSGRARNDTGTTARCHAPTSVNVSIGSFQTNFELMSVHGCCGDWGQQPDEDCNFHYEVPGEFQKTMEDLVDAFLYLGPQDLRLWEKTPADIALDYDYMRELDRRAVFQQFIPPWRSRERILDDAEDAVIGKQPDPEFLKRLVEKCLEYKRRWSSTPQ
jgi:hypothetical protein